MSDASSVDAPPRAESPTWVRVLYTPLGDLLRGKLASGPRPRKRAKALLAEANLPGRVSMLIQEVTGRTRLWKSERHEVMRELIAHFADGLESGATVDELAQSFGNLREAARLIRRAKKRQRPLWWRTLRLGLWMVLALIGLYLLLAVRFFLGRPNIAHNYITDIQAMVNANPESDRAWPLYRQALLAMGKPPTIEDKSWDFRSARPGGKHWDLAEAYLTQNADSIALLREAAQRKALGFVVGTSLSTEDQALWPQMEVQTALNDPLMENAVVGVLLPYLAEVRTLAFVLAIDARRAAADEDGQTAVKNLSAIIGMKRQLRDLPILVQGLVGNAILAMTCETAGDLIANQPEAFTDAQLQEFAHRLAAVRDSDISIRLNGERMFFDDILQRLYTDDGNGDGRMTPGGMRVMQMLTNLMGDGHALELSDVVRMAAAPAVGAVSLSRRDLQRDYNAMMDQFEAEAARPLWEQDVSAAEQQIEQWMGSPIERYRRLPLVLLAPAIGKATQTAEITKMTRDVTLTAIALELYRRRHDRWPNSLDELVPSIMPAIPPDRFDGKPLKYALGDTGPVLYCVGSDGDDDGGRAAVDLAGNPINDAARRWIAPSKRAAHQQQQNPDASTPPWNRADLRQPYPNADWILWPPQATRVQP